MDSNDATTASATDGATDTQPRSPRATWRLVVGLLALVALLWLAGPRRLGQTLAATQPAPLAIAALTYAAMVLMRSVRWRGIAASQRIGVGVRPAMRTYGLGMLLGAVTPGRVGQHVKAVALTRRGLPLGQALLATVVDQVFDVVLLIALLPVALAYFGRAVGLDPWSVLAGVSVVAIAVVVVVVVGGLRHRLFHGVSEAVALGPAVLLPLGALTIVAQGAYFAALFAVGRAVGLEIGFVPLSLAFVASTLIDVLPITVAGLGTREASLFGLLGPLGASLSSLVALTIVVRLLHLGVGALAWLAGADDPELLRVEVGAS